MTTPVWPSYAKILFDGFGEHPESGVMSTTMEDGPSKVRRTKSRRMVQRPATVYFLTNADYASFKDWFKDSAGANLGAAWFQWTDPVDGVEKLAQITDGLMDGKPIRLNFDGWFVTLTIQTWDD